MKYVFIAIIICACTANQLVTHESESSDILAITLETDQKNLPEIPSEPEEQPLIQKQSNKEPGLRAPVDREEYEEEFFMAEQPQTAEEHITPAQESLEIIQEALPTEENPNHNTITQAQDIKTPFDKQEYEEEIISHQHSTNLQAEEYEQNIPEHNQPCCEKESLFDRWFPKKECCKQKQASRTTTILGVRRRR